MLLLIVDYAWSLGSSTCSASVNDMWWLVNLPTCWYHGCFAESSWYVHLKLHILWVSEMQCFSVLLRKMKICLGVFFIYFCVKFILCVLSAAAAEKLQALLLADCAISIVGEEWLIGSTTLPFAHNSFPADRWVMKSLRVLYLYLWTIFVKYSFSSLYYFLSFSRCILLVLESSRVEIAVIINELAYLKYEASKSSPNAEMFLLKLRNLGVAFSLVERIIKLIAKHGENEGMSL